MSGGQRKTEFYERRLLSLVYSLELIQGVAELGSLNAELPLPSDVLRGLLKGLDRKGFLSERGSSYLLTEEGRSAIRVVLAGGVFDIIHPGHLYTLEKARNLGDALVVVVARDSTAERLKGARPLHDEKLRLDMVSSLKPVDVAILGSERDIFETVERVKPDVIALGYDQVHSERELLEEGHRKGLEFEVIRLDSPFPYIKSKKIKSKLEDL